jgi:hypothetical protein
MKDSMIMMMKNPAKKEDARLSHLIYTTSCTPARTWTYLPLRTWTYLPLRT